MDGFEIDYKEFVELAAISTLDKRERELVMIFKKRGIDIDTTIAMLSEIMAVFEKYADEKGEEK